MAEPRLSVRSARARDLARRLAAAERRTIAQVVEKALEFYAQTAPDTASRELAVDFYARLTRDASADVDLEAVIRANRSPHDASATALTIFAP